MVGTWVSSVCSFVFTTWSLLPVLFCSCLGPIEREQGGDQRHAGSIRWADGPGAGKWGNKGSWQWRTGDPAAIAAAIENAGYPGDPRGRCWGTLGRVVRAHVSKYASADAGRRSGEGPSGGPAAAADRVCVTSAQGAGGRNGCARMCEDVGERVDMLGGMEEQLIGSTLRRGDRLIHQITATKTSADGVQRVRQTVCMLSQLSASLYPGAQM